MKFISWNVNGLRAAIGRGFAETFTDFDADFVCLQETKLQPGIIAIDFPGYSSFWNYAEKKGYSGTGIFTRQTPLAVFNGISVPDFDVEGRAITLEMPAFYLVNVYVPTSQDGLQRLGFRMRWEDAFRGNAERNGHGRRPLLCYLSDGCEGVCPGCKTALGCRKLAALVSGRDLPGGRIPHPERPFCRKLRSCPSLCPFCPSWYG